ncbi:hypothetical protein VTK26DRAFT_1905 [Humicola hyalothermophila]
MALPKTFKQAVFREANAPLVLEERPLQMPGRGQVLVKVEACGVCHSDLYAQSGAMGGGFPLVPGHELIGHVAAVGEGVEAWKVGDRIGAGWHGGHDGTCEVCKKGYFQMCKNQAITGITKDGGYSEYALVRAEAGVRIPPGVPAAEYAPLLCAGVTVFNGMRRMGIGPGETVAVEGLGGLGHLGVQYARRLGWRVVAVSRGGADKEEFARRLGAHEYVDSSKVDAGQALRDLGGAAMIVTTNPSPEKIPMLLAGLVPLGKLLILSVPGEITINIGAMVQRGLSVHTWPSGHAVDSEETIKFSQLQGIHCMVQTFPLEKANEAFDAMRNGKARFRAVITME